MSPDGDLVVIGTLGRAHGVRGDLRARATGPNLAGLPAGTAVHVTHDDGRDVLVHLSAVRAVHDGFILSFREVTAREAAADLAGGAVRIAAEALAALDDADEFYVRDLEGCRVVTDVDEGELGVVAHVHAGAANDVLEVHRPGEAALLVPFTHDAVVRLSLTERVVVVRADLLGGGDA